MVHVAVRDGVKSELGDRQQSVDANLPIIVYPYLVHHVLGARPIGRERGWKTDHTAALDTAPPWVRDSDIVPVYPFLHRHARAAETVGHLCHRKALVVVQMAENIGVLPGPTVAIGRDLTATVMRPARRRFTRALRCAYLTLSLFPDSDSAGV